ncbi:MAG: ABC transporter permease [Candidatus Aminicenantes bacterium]|nr:ABC transporter permease [Candidatus Aminicenantes bacterium]
MKFRDAVEFSLASLRKRRLRTFLTASGVMIGIGALVSMISFGTGLQKNVTDAFKASDLFTTVLVLPAGPELPSRDPDRPGRTANSAGRSHAVLDDAAVAEIARIPGVRLAYPDVNFPAMVGLGEKEEFRLIQVVPAAIAASGALQIGWGKAYTVDNEEGVVVSQSLLRRLGKVEPGAAVGQKLRITSVSIDLGKLASIDLAALFSGRGFPVATESYDFPIVGVTSVSAFGGGPSPVQNEVLIPPGPARRIKRLPMTSIWDLFRMRDGQLGYSTVSVKLESLRDLERVKSRVGDMGYTTFALADQFEQVTKGFYFMDMVLAAVGMIAIVVAALGIVNTMVMSILERYREIGVMKAVGAGDGDVKRIFFFESAAIGLLGGAGGCVLGWAVSLVINRIVNFYTARQGLPDIDYFAFPVWIFAGALGFALLVSLVSGIYPARRAARVDPVVALRHD